jgi:choline dehydrogenase-like flavoprotein
MDTHPPPFDADAIVVGSGPSGASAAWALAEAGLRVTLVDGGQQGDRYAAITPTEDFTALRLTDPGQHRYFLGDRFEGVPQGDVRVGAQLTPPRQHAARAIGDVRIDARGFQALQSFGVGGLGAAWGAAVFPFDDDDLAAWPIDRADLQPHYESVARRIGVCGSVRDDFGERLGPLEALLPPARPDSNGEFLRRRAARARTWLRRNGIAAGHPWLAACTRPVGERGPLRYRDMEFWADPERAIYRPAFTVEELRRRPGFTHLGGFIATTFAEDAQGVVLTLQEAGGGERQLRARALVLAAGTFGTARIVLESLRAEGVARPLVSNPYTYYPCLLPGRIGQRTRDRRHSLTQFSLLFAAGDGRTVSAQFYSYRSLLAFKLMKELPLPMPVARTVVQAMMPPMVIVGVHHADRPHAGKSLRLVRDARGTRLRIDYAPAPGEEAARRDDEKRLLRLLRRIGVFSLRRLDPGDGASIHYGGPFPMSRRVDPFTTAPDGVLRGTRRVVIADGAAFPDLPAKGLTFTLMANAERVAMALAHRLAKG